MSRLDSFIRRLEAQRACLDAAARAIEAVPGIVVELGLGNGRTFDHLRERLPARRIVVFERDPQPHPDCWPAEEDLIIGDLDDTLREAARRWPGGVALVHSDIGTGDAARNRAVAAAVAPLLPPLLVDGGIVVSDQVLTGAPLESLEPPEGIATDRYFIYRRRRTA
jgi:hypothetical protein